MEKIVITEQYHPARNQYTGVIVHRGVSGNHPDYIVVYNGVCVNEYFDEIEDCIKNNVKECNTYIRQRKLDYNMLSEDRSVETSRNNELTSAKYELQGIENSNN